MFYLKPCRALVHHCYGINRTIPSSSSSKPIKFRVTFAVSWNLLVFSCAEIIIKHINKLVKHVWQFKPGIESNTKTAAIETISNPSLVPFRSMWEYWMKLIFEHFDRSEPVYFKQLFWVADIVSIDFYYTQNDIPIENSVLIWWNVLRMWCI